MVNAPPARKSGMAGMFEVQSDERISSAKDSLSRLQKSTQDKKLKRTGEAYSSGEWEDGPDLPPPNMNNFVRGDERVTNLSERDSFLHPLKALKVKSKEDAKAAKDYKTPDKSEQTYVSSKMKSISQYEKLKMSQSESVNET